MCLLYVGGCAECVDRRWLLVFAVCCLSCYVSFACCAMCGCRCLLFVVRCVLIVGCPLEVVDLVLVVVCCMVCGVRWLLLVVRCRCLFSGVLCLMNVGCYS